MAAKPKKARDLRGELIALRDIVLDELSTRPGQDLRETARRGAWDTILRPRAQESSRRFKDATKARRWRFAPGDDDIGLGIAPAHWNHMIRQCVAPVYTRLAGALRQYYSVRVVWRPKLRFGWTKGKNAPLGSKAAIKAQKSAAEKERKKKAAAMNAAYKATLKTIMDDFAAKRKSLHAVLAGLQKTMDALMQAEERRLGAALARAPAAVKAKAKPDHDAMKMLRRDAKSFRTPSGANASEYSGILRKWNGARTKTAKRLA